MKDREYIEKIEQSINCAAKDREINIYTWEEFINTKKTICVFGLGKFFNDTIDRLKKMCRIDFVCDNDADK